MLEFIVLGQVPGTHIQLTYQEVLGVGLGLVLSIKAARRLYRSYKTFVRSEQAALYAALINQKRA